MRIISICLYIILAGAGLLAAQEAPAAETPADVPVVEMPAAPEPGTAPVVPEAERLPAAPPLENAADIDDGRPLEYIGALTIKPFLARKSFTLRITDLKEITQLVYVPNVPFDLGCEAAWGDLGFSLGFSLPGVLADDKKGDSTFYDAQFYYFKGRHGMDLITQNYQGFYIPRLSYRDADDNFRQEPDLATAAASINYHYTFKADFPYSAIFNQKARVRKSDGSWLLLVSVNDFSIKNTGSLIQPEKIADFQDLPGLSGVRVSGVGVSAGYAHTFIAGDYYLTLVGSAGTSMQQQSFDTDDGTLDQFELFNLKSNFKIAAGCNRDTFFYGANLYVDSTAIRYDFVRITPSSINFSMFTGFRF